MVVTVAVARVVEALQVMGIVLSSVTCLIVIGAQGRWKSETGRV